MKSSQRTRSEVNEFYFIFELFLVLRISFPPAALPRCDERIGCADVGRKPTVAANLHQFTPCKVRYRNKLTPPTVTWLLPSRVQLSKTSGSSRGLIVRPSRCCLVRIHTQFPSSCVVDQRWTTNSLTPESRRPPAVFRSHKFPGFVHPLRPHYSYTLGACLT